MSRGRMKLFLKENIRKISRLEYSDQLGCLGNRQLGLQVVVGYQGRRGCRGEWVVAGEVPADGFHGN